MKNSIPRLMILTGVLLIVFAACSPSTPQATQPPAATDLPAPTDPPPTSPPLNGDVARGGRLYDEWTVELGVDAPEGDHPLWATQSTNTRSGEDTWRCKECHGWDYKGVDGAYGSGSHKTGFTGVLGVAGKDPYEILAILQGSMNPDHDFSAYMDEQALSDLALFLGGETMDYSDLVGTGDAAAGKIFFNDTCSECHGPQGLALNFHAGSDEEPEYQGNIAMDNPWEFIHKMRFGQPGFVDMPSLVDAGVDTVEFANVLAHAQTFPTASPVSEGGVLYDNWMKAVDIPAPSTDQPLFASQTTNTRTGADTWRCKECHGWDYKGVDGAYGSGSHLTGFKGLLDAQAMSAEDLTAWLTGGKNPDHNFSGEGLMNDAQIQALVAFLQSDKIVASDFVNPDGTVIGGDGAAGSEFFSFNCAMCHGEDGTALNFGDAAEPEYVGTVAADNPWEFVHKVNYGHPGAIMPSGVNMDWTLQDIIDLLTFTQTLPVK